MIKKEKIINHDRGQKLVNEYINEKIPFSLLQVISSNGENLGEKKLEEALAIARDEKLDLVLVSAGKGKEGEEGHPVARIMNYSKKIYEDKKKGKLMKKKSCEAKLKEIRLSIKISDHDLKYKMEQGVEFLLAGCRLKISLFLKGRERVLKDTLGKALLEKVANLLKVGKGESGKELTFEEENESSGGLYRIFYLKK